MSQNHFRLFHRSGNWTKRRKVLTTRMLRPLDIPRPKWRNTCHNIRRNIFRRISFPELR